MRLYILISLLVFFSIGVTSSLAMKVYEQGETRLDAGFWGQAWYQYVQDGRDKDHDGIQEGNIYDSMIRRAYFYVKASLNPWFSFFLHYAGDRIDQDGLHKRPSLGLGANLIIRGAWTTIKLPDDRLKIQIGRMYIPFTRNYGTTSTKTLLTTDLNWSQGGIRGGIFYPSKVGRDDGICLWGNILDKRLQYRLMVAEGIGKEEINPDDNYRYAGRISWAFWEPETSWFNKGTYLGQKSILTVGVGIDMENDLRYAGRKEDYLAWTLDLHLDTRLKKQGAITMEASYVHLENGPNALNYTHLVRGDDADIIGVQAGYLLPQKVLGTRIQPFAHYERIDVSHKDATNIYGIGFNCFIKDQANKLSIDITWLDQENEFFGPRPVQDHLILTLQMAVGF